jgi:hypothetical protein
MLLDYNYEVRCKVCDKLQDTLKIMRSDINMCERNIEEYLNGCSY